MAELLAAALTRDQHDRRQALVIQVGVVVRQERAWADPQLWAWLERCLEKDAPAE